VRFTPEKVLPPSVCELMKDRVQGGPAWAQLSLYCAKLKRLKMPDGSTRTGECGRLVADVTNQFDLTRGGRQAAGFYCKECARRAPKNEDPESARLLYVWWASTHPQPPMQLRLTGIDAFLTIELQHPCDAGPSDAGPCDPGALIMGDPDADPEDPEYRFKFDTAWSREVWRRLCNPKRRM